MIKGGKCEHARIFWGGGTDAEKLAEILLKMTVFLENGTDFCYNVHVPFSASLEGEWRLCTR